MLATRGSGPACVHLLLTVLGAALCLLRSPLHGTTSEGAQCPELGQLGADIGTRAKPAQPFSQRLPSCLPDDACPPLPSTGVSGRPPR